MDTLVHTLMQGFGLRMGRFDLLRCQEGDQWLDPFLNLAGKRIMTKQHLGIAAPQEDPIKKPRILQTTTLSFKTTVIVNRDIVTT